VQEKEDRRIQDELLQREMEATKSLDQKQESKPAGTPTNISDLTEEEDVSKTSTQIEEEVEKTNGQETTKSEEPKETQTIDQGKGSEEVQIINKGKEPKMEHFPTPGSLC